jgi:hypothetical protein
MARGSFYTTEKLGPKQSLTPEGFLLCEEVPIARTGMMIYGPDETPIKAGPDGVAKVFREEADVFNSVTIGSVQGKPVTNDHPDEDVTPETWKNLAIGVALNVRRGKAAMDDLLISDLLITDAEGIKLVQSGKREISLGYDADYEETGPGMGKQTGIIINHIALVEQGRCGVRCAIGDSNTTEKETSMAKKTNWKDALMRAFKAKDAAEVEKIAEEVKDDMPEAVTGEEGETHIHIHQGGAAEKPTGTMDDEEGNEGGDDLQSFMDQNAAEHAEMRADIEELQKLVASLSGGDTQDANKEDEDDGKNLKEEAPAGTSDEEIKKTKDSRYLVESFQDTVAKAEILAPGISVPTFDAKAKPGQSFKKICGFRRSALDAAYAAPATRLLIGDLLNGKTLDTSKMTCDAVRVLFNSAATLKRTQNMTSRSGTVDTGRKEVVPVTLAEINRRNAAKYKAE